MAIPFKKVNEFEAREAEQIPQQEARVRMVETGYFEMPNAVIDELSSVMSDATFKVYCIMIRKTFGWGKEADKLSISQIMSLSNKARATVVKSCAELESVGLIDVVGYAERGIKIYRVNTLTSSAIELAVQQLNQFSKQTRTSSANEHVLVQQIDTQKNTPQKKIKESTSLVATSADDATATTLPALIEQQQPALPTTKKPAKPVDKEKRAANVSCWNAYSIAYRNRYGVEPIRNAKTNSLVAKFVEYVGQDDAPMIAAHYLTDNSYFYVNSGHDLSLLLRDCQKIRQQWITGRKTTSAQSKQADETQARLSTYETLAARYAAEGEQQ